MKAKLFNFLPIELKKSEQNSGKFQLKTPVEISAEKYINLSKFKLPAFVINLLSKKIIIKNIFWRKSKETTIETEVDLKSLFKKSEKYIELNKASLVVTTDLKIIDKN